MASDPLAPLVERVRNTPCQIDHDHTATECVVRATLAALVECEVTKELCGRCKGKGTERWQRSRNPADGMEEWPCVRCQGRGWNRAPILTALAKLAEDNDCPTCENTGLVPPGDPDGLGCWDCSRTPEKAT